MKRSIRLAIVGAGCIGRRVAQAAAEGEFPGRVTAIHDIDQTAADALRASFAPEAAITGMPEGCALADVVMECATPQVVSAVVDSARECHTSSGRPGHIVIMSVGGLLDVAELDLDGPVLHVPAGAIGALDAVQALKVAGLDEVVLTTRKPPGGLGMELSEEKLLFEGTAAEVIRQYPKNVNVAIALSLAGLGWDRTKVRLIADPGVTRNTHHIIARGPAGEVEFFSRNMPFPENPRTSYLAALSAISLLRRLSANLQVG